MKIFISDLHLGDGSRTDDFHRDSEFLDFLEYVQAQAQELIILGDLLELWQADLDRVLFRHAEVISKLLALSKKIKLSYCIGNHDYLPFVKFSESGLGISLQYQDSQNAIFAEHGHRYDIFNRYANPFQAMKWPCGKKLTVLVASLERLLHPDVDRWAQKAMENLDQFFQQAMVVRNKVTPASKEYVKRGGHFGEFNEAVKRQFKQGARIVIFGHIHKPQLDIIGQGIYANCGTWVDKDQPTYIAYHHDRIELRAGLTHKIIKQLKLKVVN